MADVRIGISGWSYPEWRKGVFYPKGVAQRRELGFASQQVNSIEINGSFYSLQTPGSYEKWASETPDDFLFAVKGSKYITHQKKLNDIRVPLANFLASGLLKLGRKLGPILWQFPRWLSYDKTRFSEFLKLLPKNTKKAAELASENTLDSQKTWFDVKVRRRLRYAFEPRHESFFTQDFVDLLRRYNSAFVFADTAGKFPYTEQVTADFIYVRLHGAEELYSSGYTEVQLDKWARRLRSWREGKQPADAKRISVPAKAVNERDIFVYFDNDIKGHAPFDAIELAKRMGVGR